MTACPPPGGGLAAQARFASGSGYQRAPWGSRSQRARSGRCAGRNDVRATRESIGPRGVAWSSDLVEVMELGDRGLERPYRKRKAEIQGGEVVQPGGAYHAGRRIPGLLHVVEQGGQVGHSSIEAFGGERALSISLGVPEVETDAALVQPGVPEAAGAHHGRGGGRGRGAREVEAVRPVIVVARATKLGKVLAPHRMRGIEVTAETEPDVEVGVVEQHPRPGPPGQDGDRAGEV